MKKILLTAIALIANTSVSAQYWSTQNTGFATVSRGIAGIEVFDANTVWAFAYDGTSGNANVQEFTKTSNGGTTWTSGTINLGDPTLKITNISGVSATTAWVGAFDNTNGLGGIWKTSDSGATWVNQKSLTTAGESWTNYAHFFDANNGIVGGDPESGYFEVYTTSNGGTTWTRVPTANIPTPLPNEYGYNGGYYAAGNSIFFYTGKGRIFKSVDKGVTWTALATNTILTDFGGASVNGDMAWSDANKGMIMRKTFTGTNPSGLTLHRTIDGGTTWSTVTFTGITAANKISDFTYVPGTDILVATSSDQTTGGSWKSIDNGTTWSPIDTAVQHLGVRCANANTCYSGGFNTSATVGGMFKSTQNLSANEIKMAIKNIPSVYPNPTKGEINIKSDKKITSSSVYDFSGKILLENNSGTMDISSFSKGTYLLKINFEDGSTKTEKIIKN